MPKTRRKKQYETLERGFKDFREEVNDLRHRFKRRREIRKERRSETLGFFGPLAQSLIGLIFLAITIWILYVVDVYVPSVFIYSVSNFLYSNIGLIFLASLLFNYSDYFSKVYKYYCLVSPLIDGARVEYVLWILSSMFILVGSYVNNAFLTNVAVFIYINLFTIFILATILGYIVKIPCCLINKDGCERCKK
jgi:hypothetical protein